ATALHLTPSAVSHQLRQLSHELGVPLVEPYGRGIRLTGAGETLVRYVDSLAADWERVRAELAAQSGSGGVRSLRLCGYPTVVAAMLAPVAKRLMREHPDLTVRISEADSVEGYNLVLAREADIAIVVPGPATPTLDDQKYDHQPLFSEPLDLFVPVGHPLAAKQGVTLADAAREPWIMAAPGSSDAAAMVSAACTAAGFS